MLVLRISCFRIIELVTTSKLSGCSMDEATLLLSNANGDSTFVVEVTLLVFCSAKGFLTREGAWPPALRLNC